ncbi:MAG: hypothetical protein MUF15_25430 [Acidobacteria bacterium]|jgi:hypothetical protein|nr:hypothetical protein [Acidobacteriota bacterium]
MKKKKGTKKLIFAKISIVQLDNDKLGKIKSGEETESIGFIICQSGLQPTCQKILSCTTTV